MSATSRAGVLLLALIVGWIVIYYLMLSPVRERLIDDGLAITATDTIGRGPNDMQSGRTSDSPLAVSRNATPTPSPDPTPPPADPDPEPEPVVERPPVEEPPVSTEPIIPPPPPTTPYVVKQGDTMETIAEWWFGSREKWVLIAHENLVDPLKLSAGQTLRLPPRDARLEDIPDEQLRMLTRGVVHIVASGDSLWKIAQKHYGNGAHWELIFEANRDVLRSRDAPLRLGMELRIPPRHEPAR